MKSYVPYMANAKRLRLQITDNKILSRLCTKFPQAFVALQDLHIGGGAMSSDTAREASSNHYLHCGLAAFASNATLKSLEIRNVDFREHGLHATLANDHFKKRRYTGPPSLPVYSQLTRLTVFRCAFSMFEADLQTSPDRSAVGRHLSCVLHGTPLGAPELRYIKVISNSSMTCSMPQRLSMKRIVTKLETVIIPPPAVYAIDISAPQCKSLEFEMPIETGLSQYEERPLASRFPLIPAIEDSPVDIVNLARLTSLRFAFCSTDTMSRLEQWLPQVPDLTKFSIRGNSTWVSQRPPVDPQQPEVRIDEGILQALIDNPEWLPNLSHLQLDNCRVPDQKIIHFVQMRKGLTTSRSLTQLSILTNKPSGPSEKTHVSLHREVSGNPWPEFGLESRLSEFQCRAWGGSVHVIRKLENKITNRQ